MLLQTIIVVSAVCGGVLSRTVFESNQYLGTVLSNLQAEARHSNVDPAQLGNFSSTTKHKVMFVKVNVKLDYYEGKMKGLLRVQRAGDCSPSRWNMRNYTLNCTLVFNEVDFEYKAKLKYGKLPSFQVTATARMFPTYVFVEFTSNPNFNVPLLKKFHLTQTGSMKPKFKGVGPGNKYLTDREEESFISAATSEFFNVLNYNFQPSLHRAASYSPLPIP